MRNIKAITGYMIFEDFMDYRIPIRSISVTSVAHNAMVATVEIHPNRHLQNMNRSIAVSLWCRYIDNTSCMEHDYLIMAGSVTGVETSVSANIYRYTINIVDNRRFIADLPTKYMDLITVQISDDDKAANPIEDIFADLHYFNLRGKFLAGSKEGGYTANYQITSAEALMFMKLWKGDTFKGYIDKLFEPMTIHKCWEPYYWNHNNKRKIIQSHVIFDNGTYQAKYSADVVGEVINGYVSECVLGRAKDKNAKINEHLTYDEAFARLSELGYVYISQPFPSFRTKGVPIIEAGTGKMYMDLGKFLSEFHNQPLYSLDIRSKWKYEGIDEETHETITKLDKSYKEIESIMVGNIAHPTPTAYDIEIDGEIYVAIFYGPKDNYNYEDYKPYLLDTETKYGNIQDNLNERDTQVTQYAIVPKLYGATPPKVNWFILDEQMSFSCSMSEPPITDIKYRLIFNNQKNIAFSYSYPLGQDIQYTNMTQELVEDEDGNVTLAPPGNWVTGPAYNEPLDTFTWKDHSLSDSDLDQWGSGYGYKHETQKWKLNDEGKIKYGATAEDTDVRMRIYSPISGYLWRSASHPGVLAVLSRGYALAPGVYYPDYINNPERTQMPHATWALVFYNMETGSCPFSDGDYVPRDAYIGYTGSPSSDAQGIAVALKQKIRSYFNVLADSLSYGATLPDRSNNWFLSWADLERAAYSFEIEKKRYNYYVIKTNKEVIFTTGGTTKTVYTYSYFPATVLWQTSGIFASTYVDPEWHPYWNKSWRNPKTGEVTGRWEDQTYVGESPANRADIEKERENPAPTEDTGTNTQAGDGGSIILGGTHSGPKGDEIKLQDRHKTDTYTGYMWCSYYSGGMTSDYPKDGWVSAFPTHAKIVANKINKVAGDRAPIADQYNPHRYWRYTNKDMTCAVFSKEYAAKWIIIENIDEASPGYGKMIEVWGDDSGDAEGVWFKAQKGGKGAPRYFDLSETAMRTLNGGKKRGVTKIRAYLSPDQSINLANHFPYNPEYQKLFENGKNMQARPSGKSKQEWFKELVKKWNGKDAYMGGATGSTYDEGVSSTAGVYKNITAIGLEGKLGYSPEEAYYGIRRDIYTGDAMSEIEYSTRLIKDGVKGWKDIMRAKVRNDFWEIRTGQNNARLTIPGMRMHAAVGFPALVYDPITKAMYYGFVDEVSHRIENVDGNAYTEIALTNVVTIDSIDDARKLFPSEQNLWVESGNGQGLAKTNRLYEIVLGPGQDISADEYSMLNTRNLSKMDPGIEHRRRLTTIYEYMNYAYLHNKTMLSRCYIIHDQAVLLKKYLFGQWIQQSNWDIITSYIREVFAANDAMYSRLAADISVPRAAPNDGRSTDTDWVPTDDTPPFELNDESSDDGVEYTEIATAEMGDLILHEPSRSISQYVPDQSNGGGDDAPSSTICGMPLNNFKVTSEFGMRRGRPHKGIDLAGKEGEPIYAVLDGKVLRSEYSESYGNVIYLNHDNNVQTRYAHNIRNLVKKGDIVKRGQVIAHMGKTGKNATGNHLHFEYKINASGWNDGTAQNPREYLPAGLPKNTIPIK